MIRDIAVANKSPAYGQKNSAEGRETYKSLKGHPEKEKYFFKLPFIHEPVH
jgi:hypothetical protein